VQWLTLVEFSQYQQEQQPRTNNLPCNMKYSDLLILLIYFGRKEYFEPPALKNNPGFLLVDGFLSGSPDSTHIKLTYTRILSDTAPGVPALNATTGNAL